MLICGVEQSGDGGRTSEDGGDGETHGECCSDCCYFVEKKWVSSKRRIACLERM